MPSASFAARSCRLAAILLLAGLTLGGWAWGSGPGPGPEPLAAHMILSTFPADAALQVPTTALIQVAFSAPMNESTVNGTVLIQPVVTLSYSWAANDSLSLTPVGGLSNCTVYTVRVPVTAKDLYGTDLVPGPVPNPWRFMTACDNPFIVATNPRDGAIGVRTDTDIVVTFSRPVDCTPTFEPSISNLLPPLPPPAQSVTSCDASQTVWTYHLTSGTRFLANTAYSVTVSAQDPNGSALVAGLVNGAAPNPFRFSVNAPPSVGPPTLDRTGCLDAATSVLISWSMSDWEEPAASLTVRLSFLNESVWQTITGPRQGFAPSSSFSWSLPRVDVTTRVRVEVNDSFGGTNASESASFRIDTGPPQVGEVYPGNGARDVLTNTTITIAFYEAMNQASVEAAISATPALSTPRYSWTGANAVTVSTGGLLDNTTYTVTVASSVRDTCGPGRTMAASYAFSFTTARPRPSAVGRISVVNVDDSSVTLTWETVTTYLSGATIPPGTMVSYRVYRSTNETVRGQPLPDTTGLQITDRGLSPSTHYVYLVFAVVDGETSPPSTPVPVDTHAPFFATPGGALFLVFLLAGIVAAVLVGARLRQQQKKEEADVALTAEIRQIVEQIRRVRTESDPKVRRATEEQLQSHFRSVVEGGDEGEDGPADPRLEGLYRALAKALIQSPEVDVARGRRIVDARLGSLAETMRRQGAAYRLLSEAEASVDSTLFRGLPASAQKALVLVYFYALEEYMSHRLQPLVPPGSTLLLGDRGHINVRRRGWEAQWNALTLGNLLYLMDRNAQFFVADAARWEERAEPLLREAVEARNRTAHPSREAPPLNRVRDLVYRAIPLVEAILKRPVAGTAGLETPLVPGGAPAERMVRVLYNVQGQIGLAGSLRLYDLVMTDRRLVGLMKKNLTATLPLRVGFGALGGALAGKMIGDAMKRRPDYEVEQLDDLAGGQKASFSVPWASIQRARIKGLVTKTLELKSGGKSYYLRLSKKVLKEVQGDLQDRIPTLGESTE